MTEHGNIQPNEPTFDFGAQFAAVVVCAEHSPFTFAQLFQALTRVNPNCKIGAWGKIFDTPPAQDIGVEAIEIDGQPVTIFNLPIPAADDLFDTGTPKNIYLPNPAHACAGNKAHVMISALHGAASREEALVKARTTTQVLLAVASLTGAMAIMWSDPLNMLPATLLEPTREALQGDGYAIPLWIRVLLAQGPPAADGRPTYGASTSGLFAFQSPEVEFMPMPVSIPEITDQVYAACEVILKHRPVLRTGETISLRGGRVYRLEERQQGVLTDRPVLRFQA